MSLQLDARQRAMLQEMGVRVFAPHPDPAPVADSAAPAPSRRAVVRAELRPAETAPAPSVVERTLREVALDSSGLEWDALADAVTAWAAARGRKAVFGAGDLRPDWLCVGEPPTEEEERLGLPFAGDAGKLLDNMLAAVGASRQRGAYLTGALKCRPGADRSQETEEVAQSLAFLQRQVELLQPRVILAMGRYPVQVLLQTTEPLGKLRGRLHRFGEVPVVVTYPPAYLLRTPADKGRAWVDLCLARSVLG